MSFEAGLKAGHKEMIEDTKETGLALYRERAFSQFLKMGLPTRKDEDWKYTSLASIKEGDFDFIGEPHLPRAEEIEACKVAGTYTLVAVNGVLIESLSDDIKEAGLLVQSLKGLELARFLGSGALKPYAQTAFSLLNESFNPALTLIDVAKESSISKPLHLIHISTQMNQDRASFSCPRVVLRLDSRSKLEFIESYMGVASQCLSNSLTDIELCQSAHLKHLRIHDEPKDGFHIGATRVHHAAKSHLESLIVSVGNQLLRHDLRVHLREEGAFSSHNGLYLTRGEQHHDHHSWIVHEVGGGHTEQLYKGILDDRSRGVFNGKVVIEEGAQKANSEQLNKNLLLSRGAEVNSKPELEIYADDVKATHGSTTGQLDEDEVLYLQTRAIPKSLAIQMISRGFALDPVLRLENKAMREYATRCVTRALGELHIEEQSHGNSK